MRSRSRKSIFRCIQLLISSRVGIFGVIPLFSSGRVVQHSHSTRVSFLRREALCEAWIYVFFSSWIRPLCLESRNDRGLIPRAGTESLFIGFFRHHCEVKISNLLTSSYTPLSLSLSLAWRGNVFKRHIITIIIQQQQQLHRTLEIFFVERAGRLYLLPIWMFSPFKWGSELGDHIWRMLPRSWIVEDRKIEVNEFSRCYS